MRGGVLKEKSSGRDLYHRLASGVPMACCPLLPQWTLKVTKAIPCNMGGLIYSNRVWGLLLYYTYTYNQEPRK